MKEKVLIISYYWPPAGGPGVQRWLKFCKYLPDFGIEPHVYVPENPAYPITDKSLEKEVSEDLKIIKRPIFEPARISKILAKEETKQLSSGIIPEDNKQSRWQQAMLYIRGNYFIPDARRYWIKPSVKFLVSYIQENNIQKIITTGPPHSMHMIGLGLKEKFPSLLWLADFRDPWTNIGYHQKLKLTEESVKRHQVLEQNILSKADVICVTSFQTQHEFSQKTDRTVHVITNGYDARPKQPIEIDESFSIAHIGSLLSDRNPEVLWGVLAECIQENEHFKQFFELHLIGKVSETILSSLERFGLKQYVKFLGYVSHKKALQYQEESQVLLLLEINSEETRGIIPGKLFEYLSAKRPILAIGPSNWDVAKILFETQSGNAYTYDDEATIKQQILYYFELFLKGKLHANPINIEKYSRKSLTQQLVQILSD